MAINKTPAKVPPGATKIPANGKFHPVGKPTPAPLGVGASGKPANNQPKTK
jgi:hypothetical protein